MIDVKDLRYTYASAREETLHGLGFEIAEREVFGFLGPSGAGKSTTQKTLIGLLKGYEGSVRVMGHEVSGWGKGYYEHLGVAFELPNHYLKLTARENLEYFRSLYAGKTHAPEDVLGWVGLLDDADKRVAQYSKGMKVRLSIARSIIHRPKILFLDEPTNGLDPVNARMVMDLVLRLRDDGATVFVTTHDMMVADRLCDRVAFITAGAIGTVDAPEVLKKRYGKRTVRVEYLGREDRILTREFPVDGVGDNSEFINLLRTARRVETIHSQETTLENVFIEVTGQELAG